MTREAPVQRRIIRYLRECGPSVAYRNIHGDPYGVAGDPDIIGSVDGRAFVFEVKHPGWTVTDAWLKTSQARRLGAWLASGAIGGVVTSVDEVRVIVERAGSDAP